MHPKKKMKGNTTFPSLFYFSLLHGSLVAHQSRYEHGYVAVSQNHTVFNQRFNLIRLAFLQFSPSPSLGVVHVEI